jgi:hypothetical protein
MALADNAANDDKPQTWLFAPHGYPIHYVLTHGFQNQYPKFAEDGSLSENESDQFPGMEVMELPGGGEMVLDADNNEFDIGHCRALTVYDSFDPNDFDSTTAPAIEPWPHEIVKACMRVAALRGVKFEFEQMRRCMPVGFEDDTIRVALDTIVGGKLDGQIAELELMIGMFRKDRTEPTTLVEADEETDDGAA